MGNDTEIKQGVLVNDFFGYRLTDCASAYELTKGRPIPVTTDPATFVPGQRIYVNQGTFKGWVPGKVMRMSWPNHVLVELVSFDPGEGPYKRVAKSLVCAKLPLYVPRGAIVKPLIPWTYFLRASWIVTSTTVLAVTTLLFLMLYFAGLPGIFSKLTVLLHSNPVFWVLLVGGIAYSFWRRHKNPTELLLTELPVQLGVSVLSIYLIAGLFFYHGSDLPDQEIWNGHVERATYQEVWDSTVCSQCSPNDKDCRSECHCSTNAEMWELKTNNGQAMPTSREIYSNLVSQFDNEDRVSSKGNQCAGHRGTLWETKYDGSINKVVPTASFHPYVNYFKASKAFRTKKKRGVKGYEKYLLPYPQIHDGAFGPVEVDRVLTAGVTVPSEWQEGVDRALDKALATLGAAKQVNVLVYVVGADANFYRALEVAWEGGKKNDVIVLVGVTDFPSIKWVSIMSWAANPEFNRQLKDRLVALGNLADGGLFAQQIIDQLTLPPAEAGYTRLPMEELSHLAGEASIEYWASFGTIVAYAFAVWLTSWILENNGIRMGSPPPPLDIRLVCSHCSRQYKVAEQEVCGKDLLRRSCPACTIPSGPG